MRAQPLRAHPVAGHALRLVVLGVTLQPVGAPRLVSLHLHTRHKKGADMLHYCMRSRLVRALSASTCTQDTRNFDVIVLQHCGHILGYENAFLRIV